MVDVRDLRLRARIALRHRRDWLWGRAPGDSTLHFHDDRNRVPRHLRFARRSELRAIPSTVAARLQRLCAVSDAGARAVVAGAELCKRAATTVATRIGVRQLSALWRDIDPHVELLQ